MIQSFVRAAAMAACLLAAPLAAQRPPAVVVASPVAEREVSSGHSFVGTVEPLRSAVIGSAVAGRVVEFPINDGDRVKAKGMLAQLLTTTIKHELAAAEAELELRKQELLELENGSQKEDIDQAEAAMMAAESLRVYQEQRTQRLEALGASAARETRAEAAASAKSATQQYRRAKAAYDLAVKGPRVEKIAQARARVAVQQANVDQLKDRITKYTVISRFDGYVVAEHTEVGEWLQVGDPVAEVAAMDEVEIVAQVVENQVPFVHVGESVRVELPSLANRVFTGKVASISPQGDVRSRTFPVRIRVTNEIDDRGPLIKAGMFARVTLPTGSKELALLAPKDAIVLGGPQPLVFAVRQQGEQAVAEAIPVRLGVASGNLIQVIGEIAPGTQVIVQGNERIRPGQAVKVARVQPLPPAQPGSYE